MSLRFKDAVKECSNALEVHPSSNKALLRRAYSYEKQGLYKQALADLQVCSAGRPHLVQTGSTAAAGHGWLLRGRHILLGSVDASVPAAVALQLHTRQQQCTAQGSAWLLLGVTSAAAEEAAAADVPDLSLGRRGSSPAARENLGCT